jgi:hypothetical protein
MRVELERSVYGWHDDGRIESDEMDDGDDESIICHADDAGVLAGIMALSPCLISSPSTPRATYYQLLSGMHGCGSGGMIGR